MWNVLSNKATKNKKSRLDLFNESTAELYKPTYEYFLARAGERKLKKVQKKGININSRTYISADMPSVGTVVNVVTNIDNIQEIYVYSEHYELLCIAYDNSVASLSAEQHKAIKKSFNKELQAINKVIKDVNVGEFTRKTLEIEKRVLKQINEEKLSDTNFVVIDDNSQEAYKQKRALLNEISSCDEYVAPDMSEASSDDEMTYEELIKRSKIG